MTIWSVPGTIVRVVDGDTLRIDLDLGWRVWLRNEPVRLEGIDAPELKTDEGKKTKSRVEELAPPGTIVQVRSHSLDKYGRALADVILPGGFSLGGVLLEEELALPYPP